MLCGSVENIIETVCGNFTFRFRVSFLSPCNCHNVKSIKRTFLESSPFLTSNVTLTLTWDLDLVPDGHTAGSRREVQQQFQRQRPTRAARTQSGGRCGGGIHFTRRSTSSSSSSSSTTTTTTAKSRNDGRWCHRH